MQKIREALNPNSAAVLSEKVSVMIEILMVILKCSYSDAYSIITESNVYKYMENLDYATLYNSPQANLSDIGSKLRASKNPMGYVITDKSIRDAVLYLRQLNMGKH